MPEKSLNVFSPPDGWRYDNITDERRKLLAAQTTLDLLVEQIVANGCVNAVVLHEACNDRSGAELARRISARLVATNAIGARAIDRLIHGAAGLRARYASHPASGKKANQWLCHLLSHAIAAGRIDFSPDMERSDRSGLRRQIESSMSLPSAATWFGTNAPVEAASLTQPYVTCNRWSQSGANLAGVASELSREGLRLSEDQAIAMLANGRRLLPSDHLVLRGAFKTRQGTEYLPTANRTRDLQIHLTGSDLDTNR